ncbi:histidine kinase [Glaciecola sp. MH2013]|nr:histidine kinase [Glaciecola sp. MH2013]
MQTVHPNQERIKGINFGNSSPIKIESFSAIITWFAVSGSAIYFMLRADSISMNQTYSALALFVLYLVLWLFASRDEHYENERVVRRSLTVALFLVIVGIYFTVPFPYVAIFMVIWSAILPYLINIKWAFLLSPLWSSILYFVFEFYWGFNNMAVSAVLFWTFNLFALVMVNTTIKEKKSRETVETINRELVSTQQLLNQAAEQAERVRIARNIHDLLGHHLTALTINLQVASRQTDTLQVDESSQSNKQQIKESIEQCHSLAKLLLSDVREAVSDIRSKSSIELVSAIKAISERLPNLDIKVDYANDINIDDVNMADVLIRCIQESFTNSLKHSKATNVEVQFKKINGLVEVIIQDNGNEVKKKAKHTVNPTRGFKAGNGLTGIVERVSLLKGKADFFLNDKGFVTHLSLPMATYD